MTTIGHAAHHDFMRAASGLAAGVPRQTDHVLHDTLLRCLHAHVPLRDSSVAGVRL